MRAASRLLAAVKQGKFLEPGAPTGLTGLYTHPTPRASLIYLYNSTLDKLQKIPESSVYRKSTEALTKHRLAIVEAAKPEGLEAWRERMKKKMEEVEQSLQDDPTELQKFQAALKAGRMISFQSVFRREEDERDVEWNGEPKGPFIREGPVSSKERELVFEPEGKPIDPTTGEEFGARSSHVIEPEPSLTAEQYVPLIQRRAMKYTHYF